MGGTKDELEDFNFKWGVFCKRKKTKKIEIISIHHTCWESYYKGKKRSTLMNKNINLLHNFMDMGKVVTKENSL